MIYVYRRNLRMYIILPYLLIRAQNIFANLPSPLKEVLHMSVDFPLFFFIF